MFSRRSLRILFLTSLALLPAAGAFAQVSSTAALFLRIPPGARAAGMGEAFVAIADDATATHWNPAGLGNYPLTSEWFDIDIPAKFRPVRKIALFRNDVSEVNYRRFDIWALSDIGLVKYNLNRWYQGEIIETRPGQTAESILRQYTGLSTDEAGEKIERLMDKIGRTNNPRPREDIEELYVKISTGIPDDHKIKPDIMVALDSLRAAYDECLIDWDKVRRAEDQYHSAMKDSSLSESEADKILFAVEKARRKYLPEELTIPFDVNFEGDINDIAADDKYLWVATESGLYRYNGRNWQHFGIDEGLPVLGINNIKLLGKVAFLGTDEGLVEYNTGAFKLHGYDDSLPSGPVEAVAASSLNKVWAVVDGDLYFFDGKSWKNYMEYTDVLEETPETIYKTRAIFGTPQEKETFLRKFEDLNKAGERKESATETGLIGSIEQLSELADSAGVLEAVKKAKERGFSPPQIDSVRASAAREKEQAKVGTMYKVPYTAGFRFNVTDMEVDRSGNLWVGTDHGLMQFDGREWRLYGYRTIPVEETTPVMELALNQVNGDSTRAQRLAVNLKTVNQIDGDMIPAGREVKVYVNPAGSRINDIRVTHNRIFVATANGTIRYEKSWGRYNEENLGRVDVSAVDENDGNYWFATDDEVKVRAAAASELTVMHVNWLPDLADDLYYEFMSFVKNVRGWGTLGGNIVFLNYGSMPAIDEHQQVIGEISAFEIAVTLSYGTPLTSSLSGGISAKVIYSHLSDIAVGQEKGSGTSTGFALDVGLLYNLTDRFTVGAAVTNIGPDISYIDVSQSDPLPRNLALGFAWRVIESQYNRLTLTAEANKMLVHIDRPTQELKEVILNGGAEYWYGNFIAFRGGYVYDQEGDVKTPTLGFGLAYNAFQFDFAYIPSNDDVALANTMWFSLGVNF